LQEDGASNGAQFSRREVDGSAAQGAQLRA